MALSSYVQLQVEVDWDNSGTYDGGTEDISAYVRTLNTLAGRAAITDDFAPSECRFVVANSDGRFNPLDSASALYPNVVPGRPCRVRATYNSVTYPQWVGRVSPSRVRFQVDADAEFAGYDALEQFRLGRTNTALQQNKRVDQVLGVILDDIGWPAGARALDTALETLGTFTNHNRTPLNALQLATRQEQEGGSWIDKAGAFTFRNRHYRSTTAALLTLSGMDSLEAELRQDDLVSDVKVTYTPVTIDVANSVIYTGPGTRKLAAGATTTWDVAFNGLGASSPVTPVVSTDLIANAQPDGSGTDKSAQISVAAFTSTSGGATISVANADSSPVYLTTEQVRGLAIVAGQAVVTATVASPLVSGQRLSRELEFVESSGTASAYAAWLRSTRGGWQPRVTVEIVPDTDALMVAVLDADTWDRVTIADTGATWLSQISGDYVIEAREVQFLGPGMVRARWTLFSEDMSAGNLFRISGAAGGGADYSTIVAAAATTGDRIGW